MGTSGLRTLLVLSVILCFGLSIGRADETQVTANRLVIESVQESLDRIANDLKPFSDQAIAKIMRQIVSAPNNIVNLTIIVGPELEHPLPTFTLNRVFDTRWSLKITSFSDKRNPTSLMVVQTVRLSSGSYSSSCRRLVISEEGEEITGAAKSKREPIGAIHHPKER